MTDGFLMWLVKNIYFKSVTGYIWCKILNKVSLVVLLIPHLWTVVLALSLYKSPMVEYQIIDLIYLLVDNFLAISTICKIYDPINWMWQKWRLECPGRLHEFTNPRRKRNNVAVPPPRPGARPVAVGAGWFHWLCTMKHSKPTWTYRIRDTKSRRWSTTCSHIRRSGTLVEDNEPLADDVCHETQTKAGLWSDDMLSHLGQSGIYCSMLRRPDVQEEICKCQQVGTRIVLWTNNILYISGPLHKQSPHLQWN